MKCEWQYPLTIIVLLRCCMHAKIWKFTEHIILAQCDKRFMTFSRCRRLRSTARLPKSPFSCYVCELHTVQFKYVHSVLCASFSISSSVTRRSVERATTTAATTSGTDWIARNQKFPFVVLTQTHACIDINGNIETNFYLHSCRKHSCICVVCAWSMYAMHRIYFFLVISLGLEYIEFCVNKLESVLERCTDRLIYIEMIVK